jgi:hypothetical protein
MEKQSAESAKKKPKSGEGAKSFDETTDEELKELAKSVDVKTRIQVTLEEQESPKEKQHDPLEDEELKEINLKGRLEAFKQETEKNAAESKVKTVFYFTRNIQSNVTCISGHLGEIFTSGYIYSTGSNFEES